MSIALRKPMSLAEFLEWEERQEFKHEFDGIFPVAMSGVTRAHAIIQRNLFLSVGGRLRGGRCEFFGSDLKIEVAGSIRYPDGFVVCTSGPGNSRVVRDPVTIFEILSPSTASVDRIVKAREYAATPSVQRYVMLEQDRIAATVFARTGTDWPRQIVLDGEILSLPEIGLDLPLAEFYQDVAFSAEPGSAE